MAIDQLVLKRRIFLRGALAGVGVMMGLPYLESIYGRRALAQTLDGKRRKRFACFYHPNGVILEKVADNLDGYEFFPERNSETDFNLRQSNLIALDDLNLRDHLTILKGVRGPSGSGNAHMKGIASFLTGVGIPNDRIQTHQVSFDTYLENKIANDLAMKSLYLVGNPELDKPNNNEYNNRLKNALSFTADDSLRSPRNDYKNLFSEIFAGVTTETAPDEQARRSALRKSVLDSVGESRTELDKHLSASDRRIVDNYYTRIREIENRIDHFPSDTPTTTCDVNTELGELAQNYDTTTRVDNLEPLIDVTNEMMALAFACDRTRVLSFMFGGEAAGCRYTNLSVDAHFHNNLSHNSSQTNDTSKKHRRVDRFHVQKIGEFARKLREIPEQDGTTALDNSIILSGSGLAKGYSHNHDPLPVLLLGHGGGSIAGGRYLELNGDDKHMAVLLTTLARILTDENDNFGENSSGRTLTL